MGHRTPNWREDGSLTVNVWAPSRLVDNPTATKRPVLVWFHGGGFTSGSGGWDWYDGGRLADRGDIVVVTANYRVGALGFLHLPQIGAENIGVRDQVAVMHWVRRYISEFGGDPDNLTVGGQSAGAFSALYLALDPDTTSTITRLIAQSGPWGMSPQEPAEAAEHTERFLRLLGLTANRPEALREVPVEQLLAAYQQLSRDLARPGAVAPPMYPVLGSFGTRLRWQEAVARGRLAGKDLLIGSTRDEMTAFLAFDPETRDITHDRALSVVDAQFDGGGELYLRVAARETSASPADVLTEVATERLFRSGVLAIADYHAAGRNPTYVYQFDYTPPNDPFGLASTHCAELPFFFDTLNAYPDTPMLGDPSSEAQALADTFATAAATFVATGRPDSGRTQWHAYTVGDRSRIRHFA